MMVQQGDSMGRNRFGPFKDPDDMIPSRFSPRLFVMAALGLFGFSAPALADFRLCNNATSRVSVAISYTVILARKI